MENLDDSQYCDECGALLTSQKENDRKMPNIQMSEAPVFQSANVTSIVIPPIVEEPGAKENSFEKEKVPNEKNVRSRLVIERGDSIGTEFSLAAGESNIGRWDADNGIFPDVDLDKHDPEAKVSRRHARIIFENGKFLIEDLGSINGTFVNRGRRLLPGNPHLLNDGDEIIVGKTFLRFFLSQ
jgi:hypothetical protein